MAIYSVAEDLSSGRPRTNPANGRSRTRIRDRRMSSPTRRPLGHAASLHCLEGLFLPLRIDVLLNLPYLLTILSRNKIYLRDLVIFSVALRVV